MVTGPIGDLRRHQSGHQPVTNIELFFDLVYVFAVTQLSHQLLTHLSVGGALRTALLLALVWQAWAYTTWVTNWLDPDRLPVRLALILLMLGSLVLSIGLPDAFGTRGWAVGGAYAGMQIGRSLFVVAVLGRDDPLRRNYQRILSWCVVSGALALLGAAAHGHGREALWLAAAAVDAFGATVGFWTPGLGRSHTAEWDIEGGHFAERCQAFVLIAIGESVVVTGATATDLERSTFAGWAALVLAFGGAAAFWWLYFDRSADAAASMIASAVDPGRLGRSAYHFIHPVMIAGIIVTAAANERVLLHPSRPVDVAAGWLVLGGTALFLVGQALFKATVWRRVPTTRLAAVAVLALLGLAAPHVSAVWLGLLVVVVLLALAVSDRLLPVVDGPAGGGPASAPADAPAD